MISDHLSPFLEQIFNGEKGEAAKKSLDLLIGLGSVFNAKRLIPVSSVQISGVSYLNLGEEGLSFLEEMANSGQAIVKSTLNPAAFDPEYPPPSVSPEFISGQKRVIDAYRRMGIETSLTCAPYLYGNLPLPGSHIAWAESSAVVFANSILGAHSNREGGISALASALTGVTPEYGMHLGKNRIPQLSIRLENIPQTPFEWGVLGAWMGRRFGDKQIFIHWNDTWPTPDITGLQAISAALITYGGAIIFYLENISPDALGKTAPPNAISYKKKDHDEVLKEISFIPSLGEKVDRVFIGCPHYGPFEKKSVLKFIESSGRVAPNLMVGSARSSCVPKKLPFSNMAGGCAAVAPLEDSVKTVMTNSSKAAFYLGNRGYKVILGPLEQCIETAQSGRYNR